ncbi:unnamed protein product [Oppiella nova]|uniref:Fatty acid hydroxylase domain-containing protein n=1 Tax=Oppiella nova TaxID=334625 RepID=A0A7R9MBM9_9ACAR|nr:unnamed protein product [Oppiella nova]CAG2173871.1 unnamed protein product [Oppiella nova]
MVEHLVSNETSLTMGSVSECLWDGVYRFIELVLSLFYIMVPQRYTYDDPYQVPDYEVTVIPAIAFIFTIELVTRFVQRKQFPRYPDMIINIWSALINTLARIFLLTIIISIYTWLYTNYRIVDLPLHSVWTWIISVLLVDFLYYWVHRSLHEFNILWAGHQFHHSPTDINVTSALRNSIIDMFVHDTTWLSLSVVIPPPLLVVHIQFNLLYQIWLHNEIIGNMGFIEYIINTPRQHRVHHGRNAYCIDKNYGSLFMIWDRLFGTHQEPKETRKIVFGVVPPTPNSFDMMTLQFGHYGHVWRKFKTVDGLTNKVSAIFKGPGWAPGKPRLGLLSDIPEPDATLPRYSYDPYIAFWKMVYTGFHGAVVAIGFYRFVDHPNIVGLTLLNDI